VELHGGSISVNSAGLGAGSEFVVRIPVSGGVAAEVGATPEKPVAESAVTGCDVILADDNVDAVQSLAMLLEMEGHTVRIANDGLGAVALLQEREPDVMLLDIGMPGMNGHQVAQLVREQYANSGIMLIALTGWGQPNDRQRTQAAGFDHHLTKPVEFDELAQLLSRAHPSEQAPPDRIANM